MAEVGRVGPPMVRRPSKKKRTRSRPASPSRTEVNQILRMVLENTAALDKLREEQHIQFRRMAQLQAELDALRQALEKTRHLP